MSPVTATDNLDFSSHLFHLNIFNNNNQIQKKKQTDSKSKLDSTLITTTIATAQKEEKIFSALRIIYMIIYSSSFVCS